MLQKHGIAIAALLLATAPAVSCRTAPILNVTDAPLGTARSTSLEDVAAAIRRAGVGLGWIIQEEQTGHMTGTLRVRRHTAVVAINYDRERFSIEYVSSENLEHSGEKIHRNYNRWVRNLEIRIQQEVAAIPR